MTLAAAAVSPAPCWCLSMYRDAQPSSLGKIPSYLRFRRRILHGRRHVFSPPAASLLPALVRYIPYLGTLPT